MEEIALFVYRAEFSNGLVEHEFDHVFRGRFEGEPKIDPEEADDWCWIGLDELKKEIENHSENFTPWFRLIMEKV